MPADEERQVDDHLSHLRSDVDQVQWAEADAVRRRGQQRGRQQAAAGTLAVVLSVGVLGVAATGRFPGQDGQSPLITAAQNDRSEPADAKQGTGTSTTRNGEGGNKDTTGPGTSTSTERNNDPTSEHPDTPTATKTATSPAGSVTPTPTGPGSETPGPSDPAPTDSSTPPAPPALTAAALLAPEEMPKVNDSAVDTWADTETIDGEGSTSASVCAAGSLAGLGADAVVRRDFVWGATGSTVTGDNAIGVFETAEDAATALDSYGGWVSSCAWADSGTATGPTEVAVEGGTARWWYAKKTTESSGEIEVVGLVRRGTALSVIVWHQQGQDFIYDTDPMAATLQHSAARLQPFGN
jgi:hypothetical protein